MLSLNLQAESTAELTDLVLSLAVELSRQSFAPNTPKAEQELSAHELLEALNAGLKAQGLEAVVQAIGSKAEPESGFGQDMASEDKPKRRGRPPKNATATPAPAETAEAAAPETAPAEEAPAPEAESETAPAEDTAKPDPEADYAKALDLLVKLRAEKRGVAETEALRKSYNVDRFSYIEKALGCRLLQDVEALVAALDAPGEEVI